MLCYEIPCLYNCICLINTSPTWFARESISFCPRTDTFQKFILIVPIHHPFGVMFPLDLGVNISGPFSPTRYDPPPRTGPPSARAPSSFLGKSALNQSALVKFFPASAVQLFISLNIAFTCFAFSVINFIVPSITDIISVQNIRATVSPKASTISHNPVTTPFTISFNQSQAIFPSNVSIP